MLGIARTEFDSHGDLAGPDIYEMPEVLRLVAELRRHLRGIGPLAEIPAGDRGVSGVANHVDELRIWKLDPKPLKSPDVVRRLLADGVHRLALALLAHEEQHRGGMERVELQRLKEWISLEVAINDPVLGDEVAIVLLHRVFQRAHQIRDEMPFAVATDLRMLVEEHLEPSGARANRASDEEKLLREQRG